MQSLLKGLNLAFLLCLATSCLDAPEPIKFANDAGAEDVTSNDIAISEETDGGRGDLSQDVPVNDNDAADGGQDADESCVLGEACDDKDPCTVRDTWNALCQCAGVSVEACRDDLECTEDTCSDDETCTHVLRGGFCLIANQCIEEGAAIESPCRLCRTAVATDDWTPAPFDTPCDDSDPCTLDDHCNNGLCLPGTVRDCSAFNSDCMLGACDVSSGACEQIPRDDGTPCSDGDPCTIESCQVGKCISAPKCPGDGLWCTLDCDAGSCVFRRQEGTCIIDESCYSHGEANPDNSCVECVASGPAQSPFGWTFDVANPCSDGIDCSDDVCTEDGCSSVARDSNCEDGAPWSFESCDMDVRGCREAGWAYTLNVHGTDNSRWVLIQDASRIPDGFVIAGKVNASIDFDRDGVPDLQRTSSDGCAFFANLRDTGSISAWGAFCPTTTGKVVATSVAADAQGNVWVAGTFSGTVDFDPGPTVAARTALGFGDVFLVKLSASADLEWVRTIGGVSAEALSVLVGVSASGKTAINVRFYGTIDFNPSPEVVENHRGSDSSDDWCVSAYASDGSYQWTKDVEDSDGILSLTRPVWNGESLLFAGVHREQLSLGGASLAGDAGGFLVTLGSSGNVQSFLHLPGTGTTSLVSFRSLLVDSRGQIHLGGELVGQVDLDPGPGFATVDSSNETGVLLVLTAGGNYVRHITGLDNRVYFLDEKDGEFVALAGGANGTSQRTLVRVDAAGAILKSIMPSLSYSGYLAAFRGDDSVVLVGNYNSDPDFNTTSGTYKDACYKASNGSVPYCGYVQARID